MKLINLIKKLGVKRSDLAKSANISPAQLNNYVSEGREVLELANGGYVLVTSKTKIFNVRNIKQGIGDYMKTKFDELFASDLMFEEQRNGDVEISDCDFVFCTVDDCLAQDDGKALDRAKYIVRATNLHNEMYEMLDVIRCFLSEDGLQTNGLAKEIAKIPELLAKARGEHE